MQEDILSQDELDALLDGVESGEVATGGGQGKPAQGGSAKLCDLTSKDKVIRNRLSSLDIVNKKYVRMLQMTVFNLLQRKAEITEKGMQVVRFAEYLQSMAPPTSINIVRLNPLKGNAMVVFDAHLVFGLVDLFFGGGGRKASIEGREFTSIENRIIDKVLARTLEDIKASWKGILELQIERVGSEMNPMMAAAHNPDDALVVNTFHLELDGVQGEIDIALPYSMLEPVLDTLGAEASEEVAADGSWAEQLLQHLAGVDVELSCAMAEAQLTIREVQSLKEGDVIPIVMNDPATLCANRSPVYHARIGSSHGKVALRVLGAITQGEA